MIEQKDKVPTTDAPDNSQSDELDEGKALNIFQVMGSVSAAFLGVQSKENKERDFKRGNFKVFVAVGIIFTFLFLYGVATLVQVILN